MQICDKHGDGPEAREEEDRLYHERPDDGRGSHAEIGHGCIGCSEDGFWDKGSFYERLTDINQFGIEANADAVGGTAAALVGAGIAAHAGLTALNRAKQPGAEKQ